MRAFGLFAVLLALALLLSAVFTYPAWLLVDTVSVQPVHRVMDRVAMLLALIGLWVMARRLGLFTRAALGYDLPPREFARQLAIGWFGGLALMLPLAAFLLGLDVREPRAVTLEPAWYLVTEAIISGLIVAFIEETFFRGILYAAVVRTSGATAAVIAPSLLYAALHFLGGKVHVPGHEVSWETGFVLLGRLFDRFHQPLAFIDSFLALATLGVLLAWVRQRSGAVAACIGLHAAGVAAIMALRETTLVDPQAKYAWLVGAYDGVIGWAALSWFAVIVAGAVALPRSRERREGQASEVGGF
jgi:membrane protease YdiL (CAAX protease family)